MMFWETFWFGIEYIGLVLAVILMYTHIIRLLSVYDREDAHLLSTLKHLPAFYKQEWILFPLIGFVWVLDRPLLELLFCIYAMVALIMTYRKQKHKTISINSFKHDLLIIRLLIGMLAVMIVGGTLLMKSALVPTLSALVIALLILTPLILTITHILLIPLSWILHRFHID